MHLQHAHTHSLPLQIWVALESIRDNFLATIDRLLPSFHNERVGQGSLNLLRLNPQLFTFLQMEYGSRAMDELEL